MVSFKKVLRATLPVALCAGLLVGCGSGGGSETNANEIKIGINYELSGGTASYGQSSVEGITLAIDEVNAAGGVLGKTLVGVQGDNKSEPAEATSIATKLMTKDKVVAVLGPATSGNFKAQSPIAEKNKIPTISASATADDVTVDSKGVKEYVFRLCFNDSFQGTAMATFATDNMKAKSAVIIMDSSSDYAKGLAENFTTAFEAAGGTIVDKAAYMAKDKDFNAILTKIKGQSFDIIYLPGYYEEAGLIIKQARALGITAPILGGDGFDSPTLLQLAGADALNNVYFSNHYSAIDQDPAVLKFIEDFKSKYGKEPNAFNALGYDLGKYIADAITRAGSDDPAEITKALASTTEFKGVTGTFSMDENHNPVKTISVIGLENGVQATSVEVEPKK